MPSYAVWETTVFVLNVLAFILIGLQLGPILERLSLAERTTYAEVAAAVLAAVIVTRIVWVMLLQHGDPLARRAVRCGSNDAPVGCRGRARRAAS